MVFDCSFKCWELFQVVVEQDNETNGEHDGEATSSLYGPNFRL